MWCGPIVVAIIILILYISKQCLASYHRGKVRAAIDSSSGTADTGAKDAMIALDKLRATGDETTADRVIRAQLLHRFVDDNPGGNRANVPVDEAAMEYHHIITHADDLEIRDREFALRQAAEFADDYELNRVLDPGGYIANAIFVELPRAQIKTVDMRRDAAVNASKNNLEAAHHALNDAAQIASDPQNVHDSTLVATMRDTITRLKMSLRGANITASNALKHSAEIAQELGVNIHPCITMIKKQDYVYSYGESEDEIFRLVWSRSIAPENVSNRRNLQESIVRAMEECPAVCIQGRCSRYVGALAAIDVDPSVGALMTVDAYRNEIFREVRNLVDEKYEASTSSAQEKYEAGEDSQLSEDLDRGIVAIVEGYNGKVPADELSKIMIESKVYAGI